jgi:hypothetical protein
VPPSTPVSALGGAAGGLFGYLVSRFLFRNPVMHALGAGAGAYRGSGLAHGARLF